MPPYHSVLKGLAASLRTAGRALKATGFNLWSRKVVALDVAEREDSATAADLVSKACLRERISKGRKQPVVLHADSGNTMSAARFESRLEELCVPRSFSRPRVSNDNPYSESLFRAVKYRPDYPSRPTAST